MSNTAQITLGVSGAAQVQAAFKNISSEVTKLQSALAPLAKLAAPLVAGFAAFQSGSGIVSGLTGVIEKGKQLAELSAKTGASVKDLTIFGKALKSVGGDSESLGRGLNLMQKELVNAALNGGPAAQAIERIGLSAAKLVGMNAGEQFRTIYDAISKIENPTLRSAYAMQIFGKAGQELVPLFSRGGVLQEAEASLGRMPEIWQRNAVLFQQISLAFDSILAKPKQIFLGIADVLGPSIKSAVDEINAILKKIDFVGIGQKIGAFVLLTTEMWKAGRIDELIGLTIEAGFELGRKAFDKFIQASQAILSSGQVWRSAFLGLLQAVGSLATAIFDLLQAPLKYVGAGMLFVVDHARFGIQTLGLEMKNFFITLFNGITEQFTKSINFWIQQSNRLLGTNLATISVGKVPLDQRKSDTPLSFKDDLDIVSAQAAENSTTFANAIKSSIDWWKDVLGVAKSVTDENGNQLTALQRMDLLLKQVQDKVSKLNRPKGAEGGSGIAGPLPFNLDRGLTDQETQLELKLNALKARRIEIDSDYTKSAAEKWGVRKQLIDSEAAAIQAVLDELRNAYEDPNLTGEDASKIEKAIAKNEGRLNEVNRGKRGLGPDPDNVGQNVLAQMASLKDQMGTLAQNIAQVTMSPFKGVFDGLQGSIKGLLKGTMTWGDALRNIGTSVIDSIIDGFAKMAASWITQRLLISLFSKEKDREDAASSVAAKAPAALLESISTSGVAVAIGVGALIAAMAAFGGFADGGYTGPGSKYQVAGTVHRGEYVLPADYVSRVGVGAIDRQVQSGGGVGVGSESVMVKPNIAFFDNPERMNAWLESHNFKAAVIDVVQSRRDLF